MFGRFFASGLSWRPRPSRRRPGPVSGLRAPEDLEPRLVLSATLGHVGKADVFHQQAEGSVGYFDSDDVYRFQLSEAADTSIQVRGLQANVDVQLYDSHFNLLGSSANPGSQPELLTSRLDAGVYYARVFPYRFYDASPYQFEITAVATSPEDGAGNSRASARDVGRVAGLRSFPDWVGPGDSRDYYRFYLDRGEQVHLYLGDLQDDVDLYLLDRSGTLIAQSRQSGDLSEFISQDLSPGTYYALVAPYQQAASPYTLSMRSLGAPAVGPVPVPSPPSLPAAPGTPPPTPPPPTPPPTPSHPSRGDAIADTPVLPDVPDYGGPDDWNLNAINAPEAWSAGFTGQGVLVAVVDTGVNLNHPDLVASRWVNSDEIPGNHIDDDRNGFIDDVFGWDFVHGDNVPMDRDGHGTHVAGTIAAGRNGFGATGVAYGARIMPVQVLGARGVGSPSDLAAGIRYAVDNGADVINLSLGSLTGSASARSALQYAESHGVLVTAASGNEASANPDYPARYSALLSNVISVGAYDRRSRRAGFSNGSSASPLVQVEAPGVDIFSTIGNDRYLRLSGTSMAAPHVAGLAALALSANPDLTPAELRGLIVDGSDRAVAGIGSDRGIDAALTVARARALA